MTEGSIIPLFCIPVTGAQSSALSLPKLSLEFLFAAFINLIKCLFKKKKKSAEKTTFQRKMCGFFPCRPAAG